MLAVLALSNARLAIKLAALALTKAEVAIVVSIAVFVTDVKRPLLSTVNTGIIVAFPYVEYTTPVSVKSKVTFFVDEFPTIETFAFAIIVNVSLFDVAIMLLPFAIIVPNVILAALFAAL